MYSKERKEIIFWAKKLYEKGFVLGSSGNVSLKSDENKILITSHDSYLGYLKEEDLLVLNIKGNVLKGKKPPTSEKKLHLDIHRNFKEKVILHAHPPFTNLYFSKFKKLKTISFESKIYLKNFKIIPQRTFNVLDTKAVIQALKKSKIAVLKNHGIVCIGNNFKTAFSLIEILEKESKLNIASKCIYG